jgi:hypothetical protein
MPHTFSYAQYTRVLINEQSVTYRVHKLFSDHSFAFQLRSGACRACMKSLCAQHSELSLSWRCSICIKFQYAL